MNFGSDHSVALTAVQATPFLLLWLGLATSYFANPRWLLPVALLSILTAIYATILEPSALLALTILIAGVYMVRSGWYWLGWPLVVGLSIVLSLHVLPNINNLLLADSIRLSDASSTYSLYWNYDKALVGYLLYACLKQGPLPTAPKILPPCWVLLTTTIVGVLSLSTVSGVTDIDPKWSSIIPFWALSNLMIASLAEETFFRGIVQNRVHYYIDSLGWNGGFTSVAIAALLFGLAHVAGGVEYVFFATVAGVGYGLVYLKTNRLELAVLCHFLLNLTHMLFFTYPTSASFAQQLASINY